MKTNAFSPGLALMSGKIFSSASKRVSPSAGIGLLTVFGMLGSLVGGLLGLNRGMVTSGRRAPLLAVAARHEAHGQVAGGPRQTAVDGNEHLAPEQVPGPNGRARQWFAVLGGGPGLSVGQQIMLRITPQPTGKGHRVQ